MTSDNYIYIKLRLVNSGGKYTYCTSVAVPSVSDRIRLPDVLEQEPDQLYEVQCVEWVDKRDAFGNTVLQPEVDVAPV